MKFFSFVAVASATFTFVIANPLDKRTPPGCSADNCLRALTVLDSNLKASRPVMASSDCSKFMTKTVIATVTPTQSTVYQSSTTVTSTTTTTFPVGTSITTIIVPTTIVNPVLQRRYTDGDILAIPIYLSMCSNAVRLSSACSCIGITAATVTQSITLPTSAITIVTSTTSTYTDVETSTTTTITSTTSFLPVATATVPAPFYLTGVDAASNTWNLRSTTYYSILYTYFVSANAGGSSVSCTHDPVTRKIACNGLTIGLTGCGQYFSSGSDTLLCDIAAADGKLTCDLATSEPRTQVNQFYYCPYYMSGTVGFQKYFTFGNTACMPNSCTPIDVYAHVVS